VTTTTNFKIHSFFSRETIDNEFAILVPYYLKGPVRGDLVETLLPKISIYRDYLEPLQTGRPDAHR
jgi:hypothetical protein